MVADLVEELLRIVLDNRRLPDRKQTGRLGRGPRLHNFTEFCRKGPQRRSHASKPHYRCNPPRRKRYSSAIGSPFEALKHKAIPELIDAKTGTTFSKRIRFGPPPGSTGQEVYSIAMTLCELIPDILKWDIKILGTDISDSAVKQASLGRYAKTRNPTRHESGIPAEVLRRRERQLASKGRTTVLQLLPATKSARTFHQFGTVRHHFLPQRRNLLRRHDKAEPVSPFDTPDDFRRIFVRWFL